MRLATLRVVDDRVTRAKSSALAILPGEPHRNSFEKQRSKGERFRVMPFVRAAGFENLPASIEDPLCIQALSAPDLSICAGVALGGGLSLVNGKLATIGCYLDAINKWQTAQMQCLENQVTSRAEKIIWPVQDVLKQVRREIRPLLSNFPKAEALVHA